jgi:hypothetical protein
MLVKYPGTSRCCLVLVALLSGTATAVAEEKVRVCVIAILATERDDKVERKLECIAREVRKMNPKLTGFRLENMSCQSLPVGALENFKLVEDQVAGVLIQQAADKDNRIQLKVTPPQMGEITYNTVCGKFLPILTRFRTKKDEVLIIGVRVQPCPGK